MIKANIVVQIEDENNVYNVGDKVRVLMKALDGHKGGYEYIGKIVDIQKTFMTVNTYDEGSKENPTLDYMVLHYQSIDRMRFARDGEDFTNTWNFDD